MKFYITLASMFLCLCSFNNNVQAMMEQQNKCINELTKDVLDKISKSSNKKISEDDFMNKYALSDEIKHLDFDFEKKLINHYKNIVKTLENRITQVKEDYARGEISKSDGEILLDYFDKIKNEFKLDIDKLCGIFGSYDLHRFLEEDYKENNVLNYGNTNLELRF